MVMAQRTQAATAELEGGAIAACVWPSWAEGVIRQRCGRCPACRAHDRMMRELLFLKWAVDTGRLQGDSGAEECPA